MPTLTHAGETFEYEIRYSKRAKRMSFVVHWDGRCELVVPERFAFAEHAIIPFVRTHASWVADQIAKQSKNADKIPLNHRGVPTAEVTNRTKAYVRTCIEYFCTQYDFEIRRIRIRDYKSRWGSCNEEKTLCFHYKLSLLPPSLAEYIVAHELAHTIHLNHSKEFWAFVETLVPDYKARKKALKQYLI